MSRLIDSLPGVAMPVERVTETLTHMWDAPVGGGEHALDFRASQMNLILHFGLRTTEQEAQAVFDRALGFARKYPCRLVVLCPWDDPAAAEGFEGKLFSQCYLGQNLRDSCCCEALLLGYSPEDSDFLESQVSIWLETDLPVYHWLHRVPAERIDGAYGSFLKQCRRVVYDGEVEGAGYESVNWPDAARVRDLSAARTLPLRQHFGQFLSGYTPERLADGLRSVVVRHGQGWHRLAGHLLEWQSHALRKCREIAGTKGPDPAYELRELAGRNHEAGIDIAMEYHYTTVGKKLCVEVDFGERCGRIDCGLGERREHHGLHIEPLAEPTVLAEALFFG